MDAKKESELLGREIAVKDGRFSVSIGNKTYSGPVGQYNRDKMLRRARTFLRQTPLLDDVTGNNNQDADQGEQDE